MTLKQIKDALSSTGLPIAYHHFDTDSVKEPPFLVYLFPQSNNMSADNQVYEKISELDVELYTDCKDMGLETRIERVLTDAGLFWQKTESWIETEKLYEVLYEMEVILNAEE